MPKGKGYSGKFPKGAPDLPRMLDGRSADTLPGSPKGKRVGPLGNKVPRPPVSRRDKGTQRASIQGRG